MGRHFWNRKCRKKTWWQQEFAVFKCEATANSVTGHVCVYSNKADTREADKGLIKIWRRMYRLPETGHTVSITKEKFLNTYPPLFNTLFVGFVQRAGCFFAKSLVLAGKSSALKEIIGRVRGGTICVDTKLT